MSDETTTPDEKPADKPVPEPKPEPKSPKSEDGYGAAFKTMQADVARKDARLSELEKSLAAAQKENATLKGQVDVYTKKAAESHIVGLIKAQLPDLPDIDIRGRLAILAEDGKVNRYAPAEEAEAQANAVLEHFKSNTSSAPAPKRPPVQGAGPNASPSQPGRKQYKPLI